MSPVLGFGGPAAPGAGHVVMELLGARVLGAWQPHLAGRLDGVLHQLVLADACAVRGVCRKHLGQSPLPSVAVSHAGVLGGSVYGGRQPPRRSVLPCNITLA